MTEAHAPAAHRPCPAPALEARFRVVWREQMRDMPMVHPALDVAALGFRPWQGHWLGVLVTPWFMNLWLMPRDVAQWQAIGERATRCYAFPAGVFEFIGGRDAVIGDYQACSLFSPMFAFADAAAAHATALAALDALFDPTTHNTGEDVPDAGVRASATDAGAAPPAAMSKRDFLFGRR